MGVKARYGEIKGEGELFNYMGETLLTGENTYRRRQTVGPFLKGCFRDDDWRWLFTAVVSREKEQKLETLRSILYDTDLDRLPELESKIFHFGSLLTEKDYLEREIFVYMVEMLQSAKLSTL